jgi:hypothetical protein
MSSVIGKLSAVFVGTRGGASGQETLSEDDPGRDASSARRGGLRPYLGCPDRLWDRGSGGLVNGEPGRPDGDSAP